MTDSAIRDIDRIPTPETIRSLFLIDPDLAFLNHGSFGACPSPVFEEYQRWQCEFERSPVEYHMRRRDELLRTARADLGAHVNAAADDLVFVTNATVGVAIVARSLDLGPGDRVLTTDHEYGACDRMWEFLRRKRGFTIDRVEIPVPVTSHDEVVELMSGAMTERTRLLFMSHISSPTALTFPIAEICRRARERKIISLIDGAHAIGQIDLDIEAVGADFYTSNLHKWLCAPKGSAFLYARRALHALLEPLVVSWGWEPEGATDSMLIDHHEYQGTRELASFLSTGAAIAFQEMWRWDEVRRRCHGLVDESRQVLRERFGFIPLSPDSPDWYAQMSAFLLPADCDGATLQRRLFDEHQVEIPVMEWNGRQTIRVSIQGYNTEEDLARLYGGIAAVLG